MASVVSTPPRTRKRIENMSEQRIVKKGILEFQRRLAEPDPKKLLEFPTRKNGSSMLLRKTYFERLLSDQIEMQTSMAADVAAAQSDLKHLNLRQHLTIRSRTLDFQTESKSHDAHNNFLQSVDRYLFIELAKFVLGKIENPVADCPLSPSSPRGGSSTLDPVSRALYNIGTRVVLLLGAVIEFQEEGTILPPCWAVEVDPMEWQGGKMAIFNSEELWMKMFESQTPEVSALSKDAVNIIRDTSVGSGISRKLNWEVATVDPADCDLLAEIGSPKANLMNKELKEVMQRRTMRATVASSKPDGEETAEPKEEASENAIGAPAYPFRKGLRTRTAPASAMSSAVSGGYASAGSASSPASSPSSPVQDATLPPPAKDAAEPSPPGEKTAFSMVKDGEKESSIANGVAEVTAANGDDVNASIEETKASEVGFKVGQQYNSSNFWQVNVVPDLELEPL